MMKSDEARDTAPRAVADTPPLLFQPDTAGTSQMREMKRLKTVAPALDQDIPSAHPHNTGMAAGTHVEGEWHRGARSAHSSLGEDVGANTFARQCHGRILVVDDSTVNLRMHAELMSHVLSQYKIADRVSVDTASNGQEAMRLLGALGRRGESYLLCLVDMMMPGMTGLELAERLRLECYRGGTVPTIAVTGSDDATGWSEDYNTVTDVFDGAILKPLTQSLAIGLVTQWVLPSVMSIDLTNPVTRLRHELGAETFRALPSGSVNGLIGHLQLKVNGDVKRQKQEHISESSSCPNLSSLGTISTQPRPSSAALPGSSAQAWSILVCVNSPMEHKLLKAKIQAAATLFDLGQVITVIPTSTAADDILRGLQMSQLHGSADGSGARQGGLLCAIVETDGCIRSTMSTIEMLRSNGLGPQVPLVLLTTMSDRMLLTGSDAHDEDPSVGDAVVKGCSAVLIKPVLAEHVLGLMGQWVVPQFISNAREAEDLLSRHAMKKLSQGGITGLMNHNAIARREEEQQTPIGDLPIMHPIPSNGTCTSSSPFTVHVG